MKKLIVLLLAFAMVGGVFAQTADPALTFSGYVYTGFQYDSTSDSLYLYNAATPNYTRIRWNMAYTNGDFGLSFRVQNSDVVAPTSPQLFTQALVWGNLFNKTVTFKAGKLNDYTWATPYYAWGNFDGKTGFQAQFKPVAGLNFGFFVPLQANTTVLASDVLKDINVAAKYTVNDYGTILAHLNLGTAANALYLSANVSAIEDLTLIVESAIADLTAAGTNTTVNEYVSYSMGDLAVGLFAQQAFAASFGWSVAPEVSYAMEDKEIGASFTYNSDTTYSLDPYVTFTLNGKSSAKVYACYDGAFTVGTNFMFNF